MLLGHLGRLAEWTRGVHEFQVLFHSRNSDLCRDLGADVRWVECPAYTAGWAGRVAWEIAELERRAVALRCDIVFTPAGTIVPGVSMPQVVFAQNPWALVPGLYRSTGERLKAGLQRSNYAKAVRRARLMFFNSKFMRDAYRSNAGAVERHSEIVYQAVDDATHERATRAGESSIRNPMQILCVSAMARHKGVETLVEALALLRREYGLPACLVLAGSWPDVGYERMIRQQIETSGLSASVDIRGHVSRDELERLYLESRVFALMSHCESFGIPAVEAQVFGTPVVSSNCCAIPEVCGDGGMFPEPGDAKQTAVCLARLLQDESEWERLSANARENASKYRWDICSRPLLKMFEVS